MCGQAEARIQIVRSGKKQVNKHGKIPCVHGFEVELILIIDKELQAPNDYPEKKRPTHSHRSSTGERNVWFIELM